MIHKLRKKVFYAIFITLSILIIGAIGIFAFINYRNINLSKNNGYIKLNYNEELKSLLKNYFSKENIKQKNNI